MENLMVICILIAYGLLVYVNARFIYLYMFSTPQGVVRLNDKENSLSYGKHIFTKLILFNDIILPKEIRLNKKLRPPDNLMPIMKGQKIV